MHDIQSIVKEIIADLKKSPNTDTHFLSLEDGSTELYYGNDVSRIISENELSGSRHKDHDEAFKLLLHYIGDLHQPMHTCSVYDRRAFRNGDKGGNLSRIRNKFGIGNLHALWDSAFYYFRKFPAYVNRAGCYKQFNAWKPLKLGVCTNHLDSMAKELLQEYGATVQGDLDVDLWIRQSSDICKRFRERTKYVTNAIIGNNNWNFLAYRSLSNVKRADEIEFGQIAKRQIVAAGKRLAAVLIDIF